MADRRVTDLSYGHFGTATYDIDLHVEQIESFEECSPPCVELKSAEKEKPSVIVRNQMKTLLHKFPEIHHTKGLISALLAAEILEEPFNKTGDTLALGYALDINRISGSRRPPILASPCGGAGHILQLRRLRLETQRWSKGGTARLSSLKCSHSGQGYWSNTGGTIRQIVFSGIENESATWLAVRQDSTTTIFRPFYGQLSRKPWNLDSSREFSTCSRLHANPIASLPASEGKGTYYSDITFNPWYSRQIAVINSHGFWMIFELEKPHQKNSAEKVIPKLREDIHGNLNSQNTSEPSHVGYADGWHRILWACDINTIVVCNRYRVAVFDLSNKTSKLQSPTILPEGCSDWIIDMKMSHNNKTQIFVLTTSRIFWIQIIPLQKCLQLNDTNTAGGKILLSQQHFRGTGDLSLKLTPVKSQIISVLLTSSKHPLVNVFWFGRSLGISSSPSSRRSFLSLSQMSKSQISTQAGLLLPCIFKSNPKSHELTPEELYHEQGVEFFQLHILTPSFQVVSTLVAARFCSSLEDCNFRFITKAPDRIVRKICHLGPLVTKDPFITPDPIKSEEFLIIYPHQKMCQNLTCTQSTFQPIDLRLRLNWKKVYQKVFMIGSVERPGSSRYTSNQVRNTQESLSAILSRIQEGIKCEPFPTTTIYELILNETIHEDLGYISAMFKSFFQDLRRDPDFDTSMSMAITELTSCPALNLSLELGETTDLINTFDRLLEFWMSTKPPEFSNRSRGAAFKIIRNLAIELYLSSLGVSLQTKILAAVDFQTQGSRELSMSTAIDLRNCEKSPMPFSSSAAGTQQTQEFENILSLPPKSPSEYSLGTSSLDFKEDPAISRLRQYAVSIKSTSIPLGRPAFLRSWPCIPGSNPSSYHYEAANEVGSDAERTLNRREEARRRRRTERFLKQLNDVASKEIIQDNSYNQQSASQQENFLSSFPSQVEDIPMTQPNRGIFGSRFIQKRKVKKHRTAGF